MNRQHRLLLSSLVLCSFFLGFRAQETAVAIDASGKQDESSSLPSVEENKPASRELDNGTNATVGGIAQNETTSTSDESTIQITDNHPIQTGPLIDLFGAQLLSLEMIDEKSAQLKPHFTSDALRNKKVIGVYFSADWCNPCRQFTPELVNFYNKMNTRRGQKDQFEIVWVSRCRDVNSYGQYFTHMGDWYALPPEEAMGARGTMLSDLYKVKGIPTLVLLDELGSVITTDGRNKIPQDKAGIGFPWRNPLATLYMTLVPRSFRYMVKAQIGTVKDKVVGRFLGRKNNTPTKTAA
jgi:nucleoredoxin